MKASAASATVGEWARLRWVISAAITELDLVISSDPAAMLAARPELLQWSRVDTKHLAHNVTIWARPLQ